MSKVEEILKETTEAVGDLIERILAIEKEYENKKNIHLDKSLEKQIGEKISKLIEKEISE